MRSRLAWGCEDLYYIAKSLLNEIANQHRLVYVLIFDVKNAHCNMHLVLFSHITILSAMNQMHLHKG